MAVEKLKGLTKFNDMYDLVDYVEERIGWAMTIEALAEAVNKDYEVRDGDGEDDLDFDDADWEFCLMDKKEEDSEG